MIDTETLSQKANTVVLSVGVVVFNAESLTDSTYIVPSLAVQMGKRGISADTLCWWMSQGDAAKKVFQESLSSDLTIAGVASDFSCFIDRKVSNKKDLIVWSNNAGFDVPIMEHLLESVGLKAPWQFWNIRCYRSLKAWFPIEKEMTAMKPQVKHNALEDAKFQAACVSKFLSENPQFDK